MRIALFSEVYWPMVSGVAITLRRLVDALHARGHTVRVYSATYALPEGVEDRPEVYRAPSKPFFIAPEVQWAFPRHEAIADDLDDFEPDVVHLLTEWAIGLAGLRAARELGIPIVASAHTDYESYAAQYKLGWVVKPGWHYLRWFYRHAHTVLAPTRVYETHLRARGIAHTGVWTRGVDAEEFHPHFRSPTYRADLGVGPDDVLVTYVGRIAPEKRLDLLLDAWERLGARRGRAQLALVGSGLMEDAIRRRALPGVHLVGVRHGTALAAAYASADIFAFPSTTETFGNVLLEAMACGVASVTAAAGGMLEFARHGENAWLAAPGDVEALTQGLARLIDDATLRQRLAAGARATALARSWDTVHTGLIADYRAAVAANRMREAA